MLELQILFHETFKLVGSILRPPVNFDLFSCPRPFGHYIRLTGATVLLKPAVDTDKALHRSQLRPHSGLRAKSRLPDGPKTHHTLTLNPDHPVEVLQED